LETIDGRRNHFTRRSIELLRMRARIQLKFSERLNHGRGR
jgi:hypothetical protein